MKRLLFALFALALACTTKVPEQTSPRPMLPNKAQATYYSTNEGGTLFDEWTYNDRGEVRKYFPNTPEGLEKAKVEFRNILLLNRGAIEHETPRKIRRDVSWFSQDNLFTYQLMQMSGKKYVVIVIIPRYTDKK
jgi:hypothetical protein